MRFLPGNGPDTPNIYAYYWQNGVTSKPHQWQSENRPSYMHADYMRNKAVRYFNYFNHLDFALANWEVDQQVKPDNTYKYIYNGSPPAPGFRRKINSTTTWLAFPTDTYEAFAWAAESHSIALGAVPVNGVFTEAGGENVNLGNPPFNYNGLPKFHSGQFCDSNAQRGDYWKRLLNDMRLKPR
jgi:hypothetical protein